MDRPYTAGGRCQTNTTTNMRSIDNAGYSLGQRLHQYQQDNRTGEQDKEIIKIYVI